MVSGGGCNPCGADRYFSYLASSVRDHGWGDVATLVRPDRPEILPTRSPSGRACQCMTS